MFCSTLAVGAPIPGPPIGGGGPAAGTTVGDAIALSVVMPTLFGDSSIPTGGEELGVPGFVVVVVAAAAAVVEAGLVGPPLLLSSEIM